MVDEPAAPLLAGVELGGTKSVAVLASASKVVARSRVPTTAPDETLAALSGQLVEWQRAGHRFEAIGIASFGPLGLDERRDDFGRITTTPKPGWSDVDVRGHFAARFDVAIGFDTDVAGAALAEGRWGAARGCATHVYVTIGTGVGGGIVIEDRPRHGLVHPELGHVMVRRRADDQFPGLCPYHGDCVEGLVSGPAIAARTGRPAGDLAAAHLVWSDVAAEVAHLFAALVLVVSPERIVVGGGVGTSRSFPLAGVRTGVEAVLGGYVRAFDGNTLVQRAALGDDAGPLGATALGLLAREGR